MGCRDRKGPGRKPLDPVRAVFPGHRGIRSTPGFHQGHELVRNRHAVRQGEHLSRNGVDLFRGDEIRHGHIPCSHNDRDGQVQEIPVDLEAVGPAGNIGEQIGPVLKRDRGQDGAR